MRPPLRVEAKVAEELRNWLTSELERLDAANTNPFAHHVVTILLQEDLDIDDEPLSTDDSFDQRGIKTVRRSKTRDKQIKAAVQFLRSAITSEESILESELEIIVNELVIRIEATKQKFNHRKSRGRDLLGALTINTENTVQECASTEHREGERSYNEVFPSLPGETQTKVQSTSFVSPTNSVWNKSPRGKENGHQTRVRRFSQAFVKKVKFADRDEAEAFSIAAHVFAMSMSDNCLPNPEAMEIPISRSPSIRSTNHAHLFHPNPFDVCWKSAFCAFKATSKPFFPSAGTLSPYIEIKSDSRLPQLKPVVLIQSSGIENTCPSILKMDLSKFVNLLDPEAQKIFIPAEILFPSHKPCPELYNLNSWDTDDEEVITIYSTGKEEQEAKKAAERPQPRPENPEAEDLHGIMSFPNHFGNFWNNLANQGAFCMYPNLGPGLPMGRPDGHQGHSGGHQGHSGGCRSANLLGAVGSVISHNRGSDNDSSSTKAWASVTFTSDLYTFAVEKLGHLGLDCKDDSEGSGYACASGGGSDDEESEIRNALFSVECGPWPDFPSRGIIASSDSGILLHAATERDSSSPFSEPSLSAPAAFQLPHVGWPLEGAGACVKEENHVDRAELWRGLSWEEDTLPDSDMAASGFDFRFSARHNSLAWPEPPQAMEHLTPDDDMRVGEDSHYSLGNGLLASASWRSPLGQSSWDHIQESIFPAQRAMSSFTLPYPELNSSAGRFFSTTIGNFSSSSLLPQEAPALAPLSSDTMPRAPSRNSGATSERSGLWPSPPPSHIGMISASQPAGYFPASNATQFMPSQLSSGVGMESTVAHVLQSAYVNSIFNNTPSEYATDLEPMSNAVNCDDLERSWFTSAVECLDQIPVTRPAHDDGVVQGRTCSKWLENNCDLGSACPFSHPSL